MIFDLCTESDSRTLSQDTIDNLSYEHDCGEDDRFSTQQMNVQRNRLQNLEEDWKKKI